MLHRPIGKHSLAINKLSRHGSEDPGIIRAGPMIAHNDIAAPNRLETVYKLVDKNALLIGDQGSHAGAFNLHGLIEEYNDDDGKAQRNDEVAPPTPELAAQWLRRFRRNGGANFGVRLHVVTLGTLILYHAPGWRATTTIGGGSVFGYAVHRELP